MSDERKESTEERIARREEYLAGRREIEGRRLRFEAGLDICYAVAQVLEEYAADCESEWFACIHEEDLALVKDALEKWRRIRDDVDGEGMSDDAESNWLKGVADLLPRLWD